MRHAFVGVLLLIVVAAAAWFLTHRPQPPPSFVTAAVTRGPIVKVVASTGTLQAVTSVDVGAEVSGTVATLGADFNSIVTKGQVLATLDPSLFKTAVEQAQADLDQAKAEVERLRAAQDVANVTLERDQSLTSRELLPAADLQTAETDSHSAAADVDAALAKVTQAEADLKNAQVTKMQIAANIDESDVGMIKNGQDVSFRVDAFPNDTFHGTVSQIRLNAATVNNVVTYTGMIDAPNPQLKLKPGMTANLSVEVARRDDVVRVPDAALRFRPAQQNVTAPAPATAAGTGAVPTHALAVRVAGPPTVWRTDGVGLFPSPVKTGLDDGSFTEVIDPSFGPGALLVTQAR